MADKNDSATEKSNTRAMWIVTVVIVVFLAGAMGLNMLIHPDAGTSTTDVSSPPPAAPPQ